MQQCHRCKKKFESSGSWFMDYCAICSHSLCDACMINGCCGNFPARSGLHADCDDADFDVEQGCIPLPDSLAKGDCPNSFPPRQIDADPV